MQCPRCEAPVKAGIKFCPACGGGLPSWTGRLTGGDVLIERYHVIRPLARGGMGAVYLAHDARLGDVPVALKEMTLTHAPGDTGAWDRAVAVFRREAAILARLRHPGLPHVIDQFEANDNQFLVMELIEGRTLRAELEQRSAPVPLSEALNWFEQITNVLAYLHAQTPPIIYRDLKPTNLMLRPDGQIVLIDFGIARLYKPDQSGDTAIYGTPGYAPPEQYGIGQTDVRSDIYSLGMVLHEVLTGHDPAARTGARPPLANRLRSDVPEAVAQAIHRAVAADPDDRFPSIEAFVAAVHGTAPAVVSPGLGAPQVVAAPALNQTIEEASTKLYAPAPSSLRRYLWPFSLAGVLLAILVVVSIWAITRSDTTTNATQVVVVVSTAVPPTLVPPTATPILPAPAGMVVVPEGEFIMGSDEGAVDEQPKSTAYWSTFYLDRTEVTVGAYQECVRDEKCRVPQILSSFSRPDYYSNTLYTDYPVINVTWSQALDYCIAQGKRLPTEAEWEKAARGNDERIYPWGNTWDSSRVNAWGAGEGGDTVAVGSYPAGAALSGALDMVGNVWEWTSSVDQPYPYNASDGRELANALGMRIIRGGSWGYDARNARAADRDRRDPSEFNYNLGFRCATSEPFKPAGMDLIPAGSWTIGVTAAQAEEWRKLPNFSPMTAERPSTVLTTTAFYLDHTEVTNADYERFISATKHPLPRNSFDPIGLAVWQPDGSVPLTRTNDPVVNVTWSDALAYCAWAGKRLPTEAEWERAARGSDGRLWPWGMQWETGRANSMETGHQTTRPVGSYPDGAGPYGSLDLAGNVWEWTNSLYQPYPYRADDGREEPERRGARVIRGGSWFDPAAGAATIGRNSFNPEYANNNVGFRCALDVPR